MKIIVSKSKYLRLLLKYVAMPILEIVAVLLAYHFWCVWGSTKVYDNNGLTVYVSDDETVSSDSIVAVINDATRILDNSGIETGFRQLVIFCGSEKEYKRKTFSLHVGSLASNRVFFHQIIFGSADFKRKVMVPVDSNLNVRPIAHIVAHEMIHTAQLDNMGCIDFLKARLNTLWKIEGYADYVVGSSSINEADALKLFVENGEEQTAIESADNVWKYVYFYFKSRLRTDYLVGHKQVSEDVFWQTDYDEAALDDEIRSAISDSTYIPNLESWKVKANM